MLWSLKKTGGKAGWSILGPILVRYYITKINIKKLPHKLCIKKVCCIFVLML